MPEAKKDAGQVDRQILLPGFVADLREVSERADAAGIVERPVQSPELLDSAVDQPRHVGLHRHVGSDEHRPAAAGSDHLSRLCAGILTPGTDDHRRALGSNPLGHR